MEAEFIADPSETPREAWISAQDALIQIITSGAERKVFF